MWKLGDPLATFFTVLIIESLVQLVKNHAVGPLDLAVCSLVRCTYLTSMAAFSQNS
jgi:hypothetical protein